MALRLRMVTSLTPKHRYSTTTQKHKSNTIAQQQNSKKTETQQHQNKTTLRKKITQKQNATDQQQERN